MNSLKALKIRPYARLLTMLGEQLIKNERIALIELIKNAYDADAGWVRISFNNFGDSFEITPESEIIVEDDGHGMTADVIEKHWLNPATPEKKRRKQTHPTTLKGRVIQGDKGIGRFAILKLGRVIEVVSRAESENVEHVVNYNFSKYDDDFLSEEGVDKELYIDDLTISLTSRQPEIILSRPITLGVQRLIRNPKGTRITITDLKGSWSKQKVDMVYRDVSRLESIFSSGTNLACETNDKIHQTDKGSFDVWIYKDGELQLYHERYIEQLHRLLNERSVFRVENGIYDESMCEFRFSLNGVPKVLKLTDPEVTGLWAFKTYFKKKNGENVLDTRKTECGSFRFGFFFFDFSPKAPPKYQLDKEDKTIIRDHRIYLYRDGIRVYPYGEPDDDWLRIDMDRGTVSAAYFLSNEQVVGYASITQENNPKLKDKTNREGLIEEGNATTDLIALLRLFLAYIRHKPYARYREQLKDRSVHDIFRTEQVQSEFNELKKAVEDKPTLFALVCRAEKAYTTERKYLVQRAETTEDLAGVGLSVKTASHDIMAIMGKAMDSIDGLIKHTLHGDEIDTGELQKELQSLRGMMSFVEAQLKDIQLLFKSSKQRRRIIKVKDVLDKVERIYRRLLNREQIQLTISEIGPPVVAKTTDAVLLQLFLNLFDNAVYWLQQVSIQKKEIKINMDGKKAQLTFSDNGPGVSKDDAPYIFEPFYSGKGEEGRGLGLYIARQLLERNDYAIELAELKSDRILPGANFVVSFVSEDK